MSRWNDEVLDRMRQETDPLADAAVAALFAQNQVGAVNRLMQVLVENDQPPPEDLPAALRDYLNRTDDMPSWADIDKIHLGEELFCRYGMQMVMILNCYALPMCYAARKGVQVLYHTARLYTNPERRVIETAQMIIDVMSPGGLGPDGRGIRSAQKVRLMHAAIRHLLGQQEWDAELGAPINQEDLAGTLLSFGFICIEGLRKLGIEVTDAESDAYLHCWNVVGYFMGVHEDMLAHTQTEAAQLSKMITERHVAASPEGQGMMEALLGFLERNMPGTLFDGFAASMVRFFVEPDVANLLAVPEADWTSAMLRPMRLLNWLSDEFGDQAVIFREVSALFGRKMVEGMLWMERGNNRSQFSIPTELQESWHIH